MSGTIVLLVFLLTTFSNPLLGDSNCLCKKQVLGERVSLSLDNREFLPIGGSGGPFIALDSHKGNYFLLTTDSNETDPDQQFDTQTVRGKIFDSFGKSLLSSAVVFESGYYLSDSFPTASGVAYNSRNRQFLITWTTHFKKSLFKDIRDQLRGQIVSAEGKRIGSKLTFLQVDATNVSLRHHGILYNPNNDEFVILYSFVSSNGTKQTLFTQRLDNRGNKIGKSVIVAVNEQMGNQISGINGEVVKRDPKTNRYLVAWNLFKNNGSQNFFQIFDAKLGKVGSVRNVGSQAFDQGFPLVVYQARTDQFVMFWRIKNGIESRKIRFDGSFVSPVTRITSFSGPVDVRPNPQTGGFLLLYQFPHATRALRAARLNENLAVVESDILLSCQFGTGIATPTVLYNSVKNEFIVIWHYTRNDSPRSFDVYAQRLRAISQGKCPS